MAKYDALRDYLRTRGGGQLRISFADIAQLVPGGLPASALNYAAWWSNEESGSHVQARAWLLAGWRVDRVDLQSMTVTFEALKP